MKKLLILGANPETVSLILKAKEMGFYTIVTDYDPHAYAKQYADKSFNIDAVDIDSLTALALNEEVDGVLVGVAEALLPAYCELCSRLGVPCYSSREIFKVMSRKDLFKQACKEHGVPTVKEYDPDKPDIIEYPVIVKPTDSCSSKGIRICGNKDELFKALSYSKTFSKSGKSIIEKYIKGDEVIAYYVMQDGTPILTAMCDRYTYKDRDELVQLPNAYIFPSVYINKFIEEYDLLYKDLIRGLGLKNGSIFFQCFVDKEGIIRTYEPGFRLNGAQEQLIVSEVSGIDSREMYINYSLTGRVADTDLKGASNPCPNRYACKLSPLVKTGQIGKIEGLKKISELKDVVSVNPSYRDGDAVKGEGTLKQIVCRFFIVSDSIKDLSETIEKIYKLLKVTDENGADMLIGRFNTSLLDRYKQIEF